MAGTTIVVVMVMLMMETAHSQTCSREEYSSMQLHFTNCTGGGGRSKRILVLYYEASSIWTKAVFRIRIHGVSRPRLL